MTSQPPQTNAPLRIAIDGNEANVTNRVGSNEYAFQILSAIEQISKTEKNIYTILLTSDPVQDLPKERKGWTYQILKPRKFATQFALPLALFQQRQRFDVFFTPGHYAPRFCPIPYVSSVMDLAFLEFGHQFRTLDLFQLKYWTNYSVKKAAHVIAISASTKKDILHKYRISEDKISIAYPAVGSQILQKTNKSLDTKTLLKFDIHEPYILYVGTIQPRKNLVKLIEAFEILKNRIERGRKIRKEDIGNRNIQLVIAGKVGWLSGEVIRKVEHSPWKTDIRLTGYVTDQEKLSLYKHAFCSTLVGLYEGFGMPALESLAVGTLPVVSNSTSLPEVVGDAGILVDPYSALSIAKGFEKVLLMSADQKQVFRMQARNQVRKFNWDESARIILDAIKTVALRNN